MTTAGKRPAVLYALIAALVFQGLSGIGGGIGLVLDPSGEAVGLPIAWLEGSPFADYLIPGVVLFTVLGVPPLIIAYGLWTGRRWSCTAGLAVGLALLVWLAVEIAVIGYQPTPPLQVVYGIVGIMIVALALRPNVLGYCLDGRPQ